MGVQVQQRVGCKRLLFLVLATWAVRGTHRLCAWLICLQMRPMVVGVVPLLQQLRERRPL